MIVLAAYLLIGLVVSMVVSRRSRSNPKGDASPLWLFLEGWGVAIFLWPVWIAVILIDRTIPPESHSREATAPLDLVGQEAAVVVALRPTGKIKVGSHCVDARSNGRVIEQGATVRVTAKAMGEWVVAEVATTAPASLDRRGS